MLTLFRESTCFSGICPVAVANAQIEHERSVENYLHCCADDSWQVRRLWWTGVCLRCRSDFRGPSWYGNASLDLHACHMNKHKSHDKSQPSDTNRKYWENNCPAHDNKRQHRTFPALLNMQDKQKWRPFISGTFLRCLLCAHWLAGENEDHHGSLQHKPSQNSTFTSSTYMHTVRIPCDWYGLQLNYTIVLWFGNFWNATNENPSATLSCEVHAVLVAWLSHDLLVSIKMGHLYPYCMCNSVAKCIVFMTILTAQLVYTFLHDWNFAPQNILLYSGKGNITCNTAIRWDRLTIKIQL